MISCAANLVQIGSSRSDMQAEPTDLGGEGWRGRRSRPSGGLNSADRVRRSMP